MFGAKRTRLETLERRSLLAADASVAVFGGNLFIQGSDANETVDIEAGAEAGSFTISGVDAGMLGDIGSRFDDNVTTNADGSVTVTGVNHGVHINLRSGDDTLRLRDVDLSGNVHINTGAGDDTVVIGDDSADNTGGDSSDTNNTDDGNSTDDDPNTGDDSGPIGDDSNSGDSTDDNSGSVGDDSNSGGDLGSGDDRSNSDDGTSGNMTNDDVGSIGDDSSGDNSGDSVDNNSTGDDSLDDSNMSASIPDDANSDNLGKTVASTGDRSVDDSAADAFDDSSMTTTTVGNDSGASDLSNVSSGDDTTAGTDANMGEDSGDTTVTSDTGPLRPSIDTDGRFDNVARLLENIQNRAARGDRFFDRIYDRFQDANLSGDIDPNRLQQLFDRLGIPDLPADNFDPDQVNAVADRLDLSNSNLNGLRQGIQQLVTGLRNNGSSNDDGSDHGLSTDDSAAADASVSVDHQLMINTGAGDDTVTFNSLNVANQLRIDTAAGDDHVSIDSANVDQLMASLGAGSDVFDLVGSQIDGLTRLVGGDGIDTLNNATSNSFGRLIHRGFEPQASNV